MPLPFGSSSEIMSVAFVGSVGRRWSLAFGGSLTSNGRGSGACYSMACHMRGG